MTFQGSPVKLHPLKDRDSDSGVDTSGEGANVKLSSNADKVVCHSFKDMSTERTAGGGGLRGEA